MSGVCDLSLFPFFFGVCAGAAGIFLFSTLFFFFSLKPHGPNYPEKVGGGFGFAHHLRSPVDIMGSPSSMYMLTYRRAKGDF